MKLHIDLGSNQLIKAPGVISPLASITVKRGDQPTFELYFYSDGFTPTRLPTGTAIVFAAKATGAAALSSALIRLNRENASNLWPHPLYSFWNYSHPTLVERLAAMGKA